MEAPKLMTALSIQGTESSRRPGSDTKTLPRHAVVSAREVEEGPPQCGQSSTVAVCLPVMALATSARVFMDTFRPGFLRSLLKSSSGNFAAHVARHVAMRVMPNSLVARRSLNSSSPSRQLCRYSSMVIASCQLGRSDEGGSPGSQLFGAWRYWTRSSAFFDGASRSQ